VFGWVPGQSEAKASPLVLSIWVERACGWRTALDGGGGQRRTMAAAAGEGKGTVDEDVGGKGKASTCSGSLVARAAQVEHGGATAAGCRPLFQLAELL